VKARWRVSVALIGAIAMAGSVPLLRSAAESGGATGAEPAPKPKLLEVYAGSPVLARMGERVLLPVRVVCTASDGEPCPALVTVAVRSGEDAQWRAVTTPATPDLEFDLSAAAARAGTGAGSVEFFVRARGPAGSTVTLPAAGASAPQRFFVAHEMRVIRAPEIPFGRVRTGTTALFLPWGSGPGRAGLVPGRESATLGPSSFDVDATGRIYLADAMQHRIAVFSRGRLRRETVLPLGARADVALTKTGSLFAMDQSGPNVTLRRIDPAGRPGPSLSLGRALLGQIRTDGEEAVADLLPEDQWAAVDAGRSGSLARSGTSTGRPAHGAQLLRAIDEHSLRLGTVSGGRVVDAVEVRFPDLLGEVALAEHDGSGGYWAVVHVWRSHPSPADQFQVVHLTAGRIVDSFAVGDSRFADTPPLGRFRLGQDGNLYQLMTRSDGMRIVRYRLGGGS
jgi:hypothetical protein